MCCVTWHVTADSIAVIAECCYAHRTVIVKINFLVPQDGLESELELNFLIAERIT
jgi:hypothetical protein